MQRYLESWVQDDLSEKMVFLGGPRQAGKTTIAFHLIDGDERHPAYLNWDVLAQRQMLLKAELPAGQKLVVLDEVHKYKRWRGLLKGFYDSQKSVRQFLVTGSARLDYYRRGGDSLQGRYHYYRLHPITISEVSSKPNQSDFESLFEFGGFPEPFLKASHRFCRRWQRERISRVVQEDLVSLEKVREVSQVDLLAQILPLRVGSPLSVNNLREDLQVAFETVEHWISILENLYYCYRIEPYGPPKLRAARKEKKLYLWDWSQCESKGARFENMVASHLLKYCHFVEDTQGDRMELKFLRDALGREIDFVVLKNQKPFFAAECKSGEAALSPHIAYFAPRTPIPQFYQIHRGKKDVEIAGLRTRILPFVTFCKEMGLP